MKERVNQAKRVLRDHGLRCMNSTGTGIDIEKAQGLFVGPVATREIEVVPYHPSATKRNRMLRGAHAVLTAAGYQVQVMEWRGRYADSPHTFLVATPPQGRRRGGISAAQLEAVQDRTRRNLNRMVERDA